MIISRTPFRISFFGGGTDYPAWYEHHGGAVVAAAINRYCYISCRCLPPFFAHRFRIAYSQLETASTVEEIRHPAVRACLQFLNINKGLEIHHDSDLPKQTGLGTSSAFAVGLLHSLHRLLGQDVPPMQLALEAIRVERELCKERVGSQDQVTAAIGGLNRLDFPPHGEIKTTPLMLPPDRLSAFTRHLMLYFTGFSRFASEVVVEQLNNMPGKEKEMREMMAMVDAAINILRDSTCDLRTFGALLHESWRLKRSLSSRISSALIDDIYKTARDAGALGGKLCGAGGGGFMLLFVEPEKQLAVESALARFLRVPFEIDLNGSQIIFQEQEQL
ncbi:MAG: kinase [Verrucomicrobiota bacterium]